MELDIQKNVPLKNYTTLGVGGPAEFFVRVERSEALMGAVRWAEVHAVPITVIGGGSNILVRDEGIHGLVIKMEIDAYQVTERDDTISVYAGAGMNFDALVERVVSEGWWGLENLSHIPGTVGGVPIQNVGAYGVEAKELIESVHVFDRERGDVTVLSNDACRFGYRDSIFKHEGKNRYIVLGVTFRVQKTPQRKIDYKDLAVFFEHTSEPTLKEIRNAVIHIRGTKFPDWHHIGTAGSFFKNPRIAREDMERLHTQFPELPIYQDGDRFKIPLGWILDNVLHLKGYRENNLGLYEKQALVLVQYGHETAETILAFSDRIITKVFDATGITVEREVVVL